MMICGAVITSTHACAEPQGPRLQSEASSSDGPQPKGARAVPGAALQICRTGQAHMQLLQWSLQQARCCRQPVLWMRCRQAITMGLPDAWACSSSLQIRRQKRGQARAVDAYCGRLAFLAAEWPEGAAQPWPVHGPARAAKLTRSRSTGVDNVRASGDTGGLLERDWHAVAKLPVTLSKVKLPTSLSCCTCCWAQTQELLAPVYWRVQARPALCIETFHGQAATCRRRLLAAVR